MRKCRMVAGGIEEVGVGVVFVEECSSVLLLKWMINADKLQMPLLNYLGLEDTYDIVCDKCLPQ